ncbi:MAG: tetratricopeptide repeat protein, partial [Lachnospiraceae bacterium]|nr:tetratricopeptide repeat protein [Lachnospiraceae bacterium]
MDRYEYKVKFQEINNLIDEKEYFEAAAIADTIDWEKKPVETLVRIGDLYRKVMRYDDAIELLRLAYRKSPENKNICYYLCKLYIKKEYIVQAVYAYNEFERIARPNDPRVYKLKYLRDQMLHVEMAQKIATLETLKNIEYTEKWAYTLAYQYYLDGRESDCVRECDELIAAFGDGKYVYAAMLLKKKYTELTPEQQKIFDNWKEETEETENSTETENAESAESTESSEGTEADQSYEYATREIPGDDTRRIPQEDAGSTRTITAEEIGQIREATAPEETIVYDPAQVMMALEKTNLSDETRIFKGINIPEEPEIRVKTVDVGQFNTIDLQKALSASVREVVGEAAYANTDVTKAIMAPMLDPDTGSLDDPEYAEASQKEYEYNTDEITADEAPDTFTETSEMSAEEIASDADDSKETTPDATTFISFNTGEYPAFDATVQDAADEQDEKDRLVTEEGSIKSYYPKDMS